jgi:DNA-binding LacI/PurR family transcriptional regulator
VRLVVDVKKTDPLVEESDDKQPRPMTLLRLAQDLGVSRATVSNAYNHPDQLSAALRTRILERAGELGFAGPNPLARGLRRHRVGAVGVLLGEPLSYAFADPAAVAMLDGLAQAFETERIALLLVAGDHPPRGGEWQAPDPRKVTDAAVDGWVLYSIEEGHPFVSAALARHQPLVVLDQPSLPGTPRVEVDDAEGTRLSTDHLLSLGHRNLIVLSLPFRGGGRSGVADRRRQDDAVFGVTRRRLAGVISAVGAFPDASMTVLECSYNNPAVAASTLAGFLDDRRERSFTAVVAMSDQLAFGAMRAARQAGLAVPGDLSIAGFDDVPAAAVSDPPLTTVRQPLRDRGHAAGALILDLLQGRPVVELTKYPVELVVRASTAPPGLA